jgi:MoxR-like ATPase
MATQNPIELEGTFPLPEAQLDRFLLRASVGYPERAEELRILERFQAEDPLDRLPAVAAPGEVVQMQRERRDIRVSAPVRGYIADLARATREHPSVRFGASPRGTLALMRASQARALLRGRRYVLPDDAKSLASPVLSHRLVLREQQRLQGQEAEALVGQILEEVPVPAPAE